MNIIEDSTRKTGDFLEKVTKSAWKKWLLLVGVIVLLLGGVVVVIFFPLVLSPFDYICIALFIAVATYYLMQVQRIK